MYRNARSDGRATRDEVGYAPGVTFEYSLTAPGGCVQYVLVEEQVVQFRNPDKDAAMPPVNKCPWKVLRGHEGRRLVAPTGARNQS